MEQNLSASYASAPVSETLSRLARLVRDAPVFVPPWWLRSGHLQTVWSNYAPRPSDTRRLAATATVQTLPTPDGDRVRVHTNIVADGAALLVVLHGLTGCASSPQVLGMAAKAWGHGLNVMRVDLRNASGDSPSHGIGHAGRSEDLRTVLRYIGERFPDTPVAVVGYSLGGNVALKAAGELGAAAPVTWRAVVGISVPLDLDLTCRAIDAPRNAPYRIYFLRRLTRIVQQRRARMPRLYPPGPLRARGMRQFDGIVVAPTCGFHDAEDYYARCSAVQFVDQIRVPTLILHSRDDPFAPAGPLEDPRVRDNPNVFPCLTDRGGHTGFYARPGIDPEPYWAEQRALDFCCRAMR